jgi:ABC-type glycerol-3-phosphate transport system substrate-binding protein
VKKAVLAAAPLALALAALAGCSSPSGAAPAAQPTFSTDHPVTIEFWNTYTGALEDQLNQLVGDFESTHPGITVKTVYQPYDTELQALQTAVAAKQPPALAQLELTSMAQLAAFGALAPIPGLLSDSDAKALQDAMIPSIATANSYDGTLYTVPMGYNSNVLYYNKDLVQKAGLASSLPTTWQQLETDAPKLSADTDGDGTNDVYGYAFPAQAPWILEARLWQSGAELFNSDNTQATFNSPKAVQTFQNYQDLVNTKGAEMVQTDSSLNQLTDLFAAGKIAMFEQSSTAMQGILGKATSFDVGVAQFPTMGGQVYSLGGYNLGVFKDAPADQQAAAAQFAQWWASPDVAAKWTAISNYMPGIQAAWDTDTLKQWEAQDPRRAVAAAQIQYARSRPNLPSYPEISTDLANAFQATLSGQGTAQSNLDSAVSAANGILAKN